MKVRQYIGQPQGSIPPTPSVGPEESVLHAGMDGISQGLADIAKVGENIFKKHQEQKRNNDIQAMQIETEKDWLTFKTGYDQSNPDPMNYARDIEKAWDGIVKNKSGMTKDAETTRLFKEKMNLRKIMILHQGYDEADKRFKDKYFADSIRNVDEWAKLAANAETPQDAEIFKHDLLSEIHKGYPFTEKFALELETSKLDWIEKERAKNAEGRVYQDILRDPGGTMRKLMLPPEAGQYPDIKDSAKRESLRIHAENVFKVKQTEQRQEKTRIQKENHDKEEDEIGSFYATGKLKIDHIQQAKSLSGDEKFTWTARIEARQKAGPVKTDFRVYSQILNAIPIQPKKKIIEMIANASETNLSEGDAEKLLEKANSFQNSVEDHYLKRGYDFLRSKFVTKKDPLGRLLETPEEMERFYESSNLLDKAIQDSRQRGKPLQGQEIYDKAIEIWNLKKKSSKELLDEKLKSLRGIGDKKEPIKTPSGKKYVIEGVR